MIKKFGEFIKENMKNTYNFPQEVISKFYKLVSFNEDVNHLNSVFSRKDREGEWFEDSEENYSFLLLPISITDDVIDDRDGKEYLKEKMGFEYFAALFESTFMSRDVKFWIYDEEKREFVRPNKYQDMYLYLNDELKDAMSLVYWDEVPNMTYGKWKEMRDKSLKTFRKMNELPE